MLRMRIALPLLVVLAGALVPIFRSAARSAGQESLAPSIHVADPRTAEPTVPSRRAQEPPSREALPHLGVPPPSGILAQTPDFFYDVPAPAAWRALREVHTPPARELLVERPIALAPGPGFEGTAEEDLGWSTAWPEAVASLLRQAARDRQAHTWRHEVDPPRRQQRRAWRGATWGGLALFVVEVPGVPTGPDDLVWTVFDPRQQRVAEPVVVPPQWREDLGSLLAGGLVEADLDGDGRFEIGFPGHTHNGTVSDIDTRTYYRVEAEPLRLVEVLHFATRQWLSVVSPGESGNLHRRLVAPKPGELRLFVYYRNDAYGQDLLPLGEIELGRSEERGPWEPRARRSWVPGMECFLDG